MSRTLDEPLGELCKHVPSLTVPTPHTAFQSRPCPPCGTAGQVSRQTAGCERAPAVHMVTSPQVNSSKASHRGAPTRVTITLLGSCATKYPTKNSPAPSPYRKLESPMSCRSAMTINARLSLQHLHIASAKR